MNLKTSFASVAVHSVFLSTNGRLYSWGCNARCSLGHGVSISPSFSGDPCLEPTEYTDPDLYADGGFKDFAAGQHHNLLVTKRGRIFGWGRNEDGQLGLGHEQDVETPTPIKEFPDGQIPAQVCCGAHFSVVVTEDGLVYTMGFNDKGQLGYGKPGENHSTAKKVEEIPEPVAQVTCGWSFVLALAKSGNLYGWGYNEDKELQLGHCEPSVPRPSLSHLSGLLRVQAGPYHVLALREGGALWAWGWNYYGQLGVSPPGDTGPREKDWEPQLIIPSGVREVGSGSSYSFALMDDGSLLSWGKNDCSQLGRGTDVSSHTPEKMCFFPEPETRIACFGGAVDHCFLVTEEGDLYMWGSGERGRLGMGQEVSEKVPTLLQQWKWELPKNYIWAKWKFVFQWLFLGRLDHDSPFRDLHVEIIFHFVTIY
jgi:alpha-tubulin suppressor-like RCC1 family protein